MIFRQIFSNDRKCQNKKNYHQVAAQCPKMGSRTLINNDNRLADKERRSTITPNGSDKD